MLTVRRSKTDQHGAGAAVAIWRSDDPDLCAPTALRRWLEHRAARHADDPLFVGLRAGGVMTATRLSDKAVVRLVKDTAEAVGDGDPGLMERTFGNLAVSVQRSYSGHSLRAGLATAAAEAEPSTTSCARPATSRSRSPAATCARPTSGATTSPRRSCALEPEDGGSRAAAKAKLRSQRNEDTPASSCVRPSRFGPAADRLNGPDNPDVLYRRWIAAWARLYSFWN